MLKELKRGMMTMFYQIKETEITKMNKVEILELIYASVNNRSYLTFQLSYICRASQSADFFHTRHRYPGDGGKGYTQLRLWFKAALGPFLAVKSL